MNTIFSQYIPPEGTMDVIYPEQQLNQPTIVYANANGPMDGTTDVIYPEQRLNQPTIVYANANGNGPIDGTIDVIYPEQRLNQPTIVYANANGNGPMDAAKAAAAAIAAANAQNETELRQAANAMKDKIKINDKIISQLYQMNTDLFYYRKYYNSNSGKIRDEYAKKIKDTEYKINKIIASSPTPGNTTYNASSSAAGKKINSTLSIPNYLIYNSNPIVKNNILTKPYNNFPTNTKLTQNSLTVLGTKSTFGMSSGGKIGLGLGCLILLIIIAVVFMMMKKKKAAAAAKSSVAAAFGFRRRR